MQSTKPRLWWGQPGPATPRPAAIFTAADPARLTEWLRKNPWAGAVPVVRWRRHGPGQPVAIVAGKDWPGIVVGAPPEHPPAVLCDGLPAYLSALVNSARWVAASMPPGEIWEMHADASAGPLAIGAALARGSAAALSGAAPSLLTINLAAWWGVDLTQKIKVIDGQSVQVGAGIDPRRGLSLVDRT